MGPIKPQWPLAERVEDLKAKCLRLAQKKEQEEKLLGPFLRDALGKAGYVDADRGARIEAAQRRNQEDARTKNGDGL